MAKALVSGGAGFIGSHVVDILLEKGLDVIVLDDLSTGRKENLNPKAKFYVVDIRNESIHDIFKEQKPDYVFHLASQIDLRKSIKDPIKDAHINILGSLNLLEASINYGVKKFIFASSAAIYGGEVKVPTSESEEAKPISPYGISKFSIENYLEFYRKNYGLDSVVLRYSNVYVPRQNSSGEGGVISIFVNKAISDEKIVINGLGNQTRDFVYVKDIAESNFYALNLSGVFNVGTGIEISINGLFKKFVDLEKFQVEVIHGAEVSGDVKRSCFDVSRIKAKGWNPKYSLENGLKETIEYFGN